MESARIVGALARYTGDFSLAEDIAQEALAEALVSWSVDGVPAHFVRIDDRCQGGTHFRAGFARFGWHGRRVFWGDEWSDEPVANL